MRSGAVILGISVSAVLLVVAGFLYFMADDSSGRHYRKSIDLVRQVQVMSSGWGMEITRVKSDPFSDFDSLTAFIPRMARLKAKLSGRAQRIPDLPDRIGGEINAYLSAIDAQEERIERFKTGHAVVRNSKRYFPLAAASVLRQAEQSRNAALVRNISSLIRDVNLHLATPTETAKIRLTGEIGKLRARSVRYAPSLANAVENLLAHAEVLVDRQGPTEELFARITSGEVSGFANQLAGNLEFELGRATVRATYYDRGILAVFVVLIGFWIALALQQRIRGGSAAAEPAHRPFPAQAGRGAAQSMADGEDSAAPGPPPTGPPGSNGLLAPQASRPAGSASVARESLILAEHRDPDSVLQNGFVVKCVAGILASSAEEIADRMEFLRKTHQRIQHALHDSESGVDLSVGANLDEEVDAISAIAVNVRQSINGIADLAKRLEVFSETPTNHVDRSMIDINGCIEEVIAASGTSATFVKNLGDIPEIFASKTELNLLLAELVENSVFAVQEQLDKKGIIKVDSARKDDEILITVIDNGVGIPADRRRSIFKPFYTSRDGAMGIGLALAGHLVGKYQGTIKVNSLPGQGTVARIALPAEAASR